MQDLKKNKRKIMNKNKAPMTNDAEVIENYVEENIPFEISRGHKKPVCVDEDDCGRKRPHKHDCDCDCGCNKPHKHDCDCDCVCNKPHKHDCDCDCGCNKPHKHDCDCDCVCNKPHKHDCDCDCGCNKPHKHDCDCDCEPCDIESKTCFDNPCGPACCTPFTPRNFNVSQAVPLAIETDRIFDTMRFQIFTDATDENGNPVQFETEVVDVNGPIPTGAQVGVTIERICINFDEIVIDPGKVSLEDLEVEPLNRRRGENCQTNFEFAVCGERDNNCCSQGRGRSVSYKQRGLVVEVEGLVLELRGRCGCTEFVALAFPTSRRDSKKCRDEKVRFTFNTLSAPICTPANGRAFNLKQNYQTSLTVDCIGKSFLCCCCHDGERFCELEIPNGIDVICCLQETVSTVIEEQLVVLGSPNVIEPRVVDTFAKVCDFRECGDNR